MTRRNTPSRGVIGRLALTLTFGVHLTSVRADMVQPLPRATAASASHDVRWLGRLPPVIQPLPRTIDVAQSDTGSLQEALKLLESRVESGAFDSAPSAVEVDETSAREPAEPVEASEKTGISVSVPQPPVTPVPPVAPVPPVIPVAPESAPADAVDATPERTLDSRSPTIEKPAASPSPSTERWQVQLLAGRSLSRVERDRDDILRFHGDRVAGLTLSISQAHPKGLYRLRALDWASQVEAGAWCRHLRVATGLQCVVVRGDDQTDSVPPSPAR